MLKIINKILGRVFKSYSQWREAKQREQREKCAHFLNGSRGTLKLIVHSHDGYPHDHNGKGVAWVPINLGFD